MEVFMIRVCQRNRALAPAMLWLICLCLLTGCRCQEAENGNVAWVNGDPISFVEFWDEFKQRYEGAVDPSTLQPAVLDTMKAGVLSDMIRQRLLLQEARRREILVPPEVLAARIDEIRREYSGEAFPTILLANRQDEESFRTAVKRQLMIEELYREVTETAGAVTDEEVGKYYDDHMDEFLVPETVRMRQILLEDLDQAAAVVKRLRKGEDFLTVVQAYDPGGAGAGDGEAETYRKGELPEALERAVFAARPGQISGPVETHYGVHVFRVEERIPAHLPPLAEVQERIKQKLGQQREEEQYQRWVQKLVENSRIQVHGSLKDAIMTR